MIKVTSKPAKQTSSLSSYINRLKRFTQKWYKSDEIYIEFPLIDLLIIKRLGYNSRTANTISTSILLLTLAAFTQLIANLQ
jgi:hypothetical protein